MHGDDAPPPHEKVKDSRVQFADMPHLEKPVADGLREWRSVLLTVPEFGESRHHSGVIAGIGLLQVIEKRPDSAVPRFRFIEFYAEIHRRSASK